jgi:PAS domain S-box-containing protein
LSAKLKVLLVEDNPGDARLIQVMLAEGSSALQFEVSWADRLQKAVELLAVNHFDAILLDLTLPDSQGLNTVIAIVARVPDVPIIILTGLEDETVAIKALQKGAQDYLTKSQLNSDLLVRTMRYAIERKHTEKIIRESQERYRMLFENNPLPMWVYDLETLAFLAVNNAAIAHYGYSRDEFLRMTIREIRPQEELAKLEINLSQPRKTTERSASSIHCKKDGTLINVESISHEIIFGERQACLVLANDITDRLRAEAAEFEQRTLAEALRDTAAALNSTLDLDELLARILENVGRVVPHEAANIILVEDGMARVVRASGYAQHGFSQPLDTPAFSIEKVPYYQRMVTTGQTLLIPDTHIDPDWSSTESMKWIRSYVGAPIRVREKNIGFINLDSAAPGFFTPLHAERLRAFADQAGSALENAHLLEETRQRLKELEAINKISTALRISHTLDEMIPQFLNETISALNGVAGSIWFYDPTNDEIRLVYQHDWNGVEFPTVKRDEDIPGLVVASGQPFVSREFSSDPRMLESPCKLVPAGWGGACVPIWAANEIIGVMFVNVKLPRELTSADVHLLTTLADIAGNTIHRMRLHEQTQQRLERIAALHSIDVVINSSTNLQLTLDIFLTQVAAQLNIDAADVLLFDAQINALEFSSGIGFRSQAGQQPHIRPGDSLAGRILLEQRVLRVSNLAEYNGAILRREMMKAEGFISYHGTPLISKGKVLGVLEVFHRKLFSPDQDWLSFFDTLAGQVAIAIDNAALFKNLQQSNLELSMAYDETIEGWSRALDLRDKETEGHTQRVTDTALHLARAMNLKSSELVHMRRGALLHDIGKMGVPDNILLKPDKLTDEEWVIMRRHPVYAYEMLFPIQYLRLALDIPYCHHEKWDGSGYPQGLRGENIPLVARIFAIVDVWDALQSDRPYRKGWPRNKILKYIKEESGKHFDPQVVKEFMKLMKT